MANRGTGMSPTSGEAPAACLHHLVERQAELWGEAPAVIWGDETLSYADLDRRAARLAGHLRSVGLRPGDLAAAYLGRSSGLIVAILAILKAGGAFVPLDETHPRERTAYVLDDARPRLILTEERLAGRLPVHGARVVVLDRDRPLIERAPDVGPAAEAGPAAEVGPVPDVGPVPAVGPDDLAYVIYTSGSTGAPKGVAVAHRSVVNCVWALAKAYGVSRLDRALQFASFGFDVSIEEVFSTLAGGGTLVLRVEGLADTMADFLERCRAWNLTILNLPTAFWHELAAECGRRGLSLPPGVRLVIIGGESALAARAAEWRRVTGDGVRLVNAYGPTEATIVTTLFEVEAPADEIAAWPSLPIGRPIAGVSVHVLDRDMRPVPEGVEGELYVGGLAPARGYLGSPALTAERFVPDPFAAAPTPGATEAIPAPAWGARLYRTGDLVRRLPDGNLDYLGRADLQVKIRGFRIELGEIEATLGRHPAVAQSVVTVAGETPERRRLVAFVTAAPGKPLSAGDLRTFLAARLPAYMVPAAFAIRETLPATPTGKIDRQALATMAATVTEGDDRWVAPGTPTEEALVGIWAAVLGRDRVGAADNFFELGGHSLSATQVLARIRETLGVEMGLESLFDHPTVAGLAAVIDRGEGRARGLELPPMGRAPRDGPLPLSFAQERVWFLQRLHPDNTAYQFQEVLRLEGDLRVDILERVLTEIVRRHEIFRTTFPAAAGLPVQVIHPPWPARIPVIDLGDRPAGEREAAVRRLVDEEIHRPFDLGRLPLIRWTLLRLGPRDHYLVHVEHHLVHDGWSFNILLGELRALYTAFLAGAPSPFPELDRQFADFAAWQRQWLELDLVQTQIDYWKTRLGDGPPVLELPTDRPRLAVQSFRGTMRRAEIPLELARELRAFCRREGVTLFTATLAAFAVLLHRYTGQEDISIGSGVANRRWRETESIIGMIINNLVLRTDLSGDPSFSELLARVRRTVLEAYANQDVPFDKVVQAVKPPRDVSHNPLFQVMFSFHDAPLVDLDLPGLNVSLNEVVSNASAKFDLNVVVIPRLEQSLGQTRRQRSEGITMVWEYNTDLFDEATVDRLIGHYERILTAVVRDARQSIGRLPLLSDDERRRQLVDWNATARPRPTAAGQPLESCLPELVEAQAGRRADKVAAVSHDGSLTYGELSRRSSQLAHYLRRAGVGPETLVGVCLVRGADLLVGLLGVLKAQGAYLPLDPRYPRERLRFMLRDSGARVVLTQEGLDGAMPDGALPGGAGLAAGDAGDHAAIHDTPAASGRVRVIYLDRHWPDIARPEVPAAVIPPPSPDSLAYVIYTSGSTGVPKGVAVSHRALGNFLLSMLETPGLDETDVLAAVTPVSFDIAGLEMYLPLVAGATVLVVSAEDAANGVALAALLRRSGVTALQATPATWRLLVEAGWKASGEKMLCGGETMPPDLATRLLEGRGSLWNLYGPTETTIWSTIHPVGPDEPAAGSISIGRPIANTQTYVLDRYLQPAPVGVRGELYIGGAGLARGYLNRPALTAERFVADPFAPEAGEEVVPSPGSPSSRLYRTGDLARYRPDGSIEHLGRADHQVKIRGFRIELGEIEATLGRYPGAKGAAVIVHDSGRGERRLVAYLETDAENRPSVTALRRYLGERLPEYMIPGTFVFMEALPLTPAGKIDRRALPLPDGTRPELEKAFVAPRTETERLLAGIWARVLELTAVGVTDDFFELGGYSLLAVRMMAEVWEVFALDVPLLGFFQNPTVSGLGAMLEEAVRAAVAVMSDEEVLRRVTEARAATD